jgi:hypothetical protein
MELNFAASDRGEGGGGQAGDLAQELFQGFLVFSADGFGGAAFGSGLGFAEELLGEAGAGGGSETQGHFAMDGASGDDRVPHIGICDRQGLGRNFEGAGLSRNLGEDVLDTGFPGFAPIAEFGANLGGGILGGRVGNVGHRSPEGGSWVSRERTRAARRALTRTGVAEHKRTHRPS